MQKKAYYSLFPVWDKSLVKFFGLLFYELISPYGEKNMSNGRPWTIRSPEGRIAATYADRRPAQAYCDNMNRAHGGGYTLSHEG